uniref:Uncharacterized protein LOC114331283 n=1 Tax=Diabrotica virgifera virgifera TaxID=50390 RepID=A0A6P7FKE0_DIAVI
MAENNLTFLEAKDSLKRSYTSAVTTTNRFEALGTINNERFPPLPRQNNVKHNISKPSTSSIQQQIQKVIPSQPETSSQYKKRKAQSPLAEEMFPFQFGPKNPLPPNVLHSSDSDPNTDEFINMFFNFLKSVLKEFDSFNDLERLDRAYIYDKIIKYNKLK